MSDFNLAEEVGNFPRTKRDSDQGLTPLNKVSKDAIDNRLLGAMYAEMRRQGDYLRNVNRLVNFVWAGLIAVVAIAVAGVVGWVLIVSVLR